LVVPDHSCYAQSAVIDLSSPGGEGGTKGIALAPVGSVQGHLATGAVASDYLVVLMYPDAPQIAFPDVSGAFKFDNLRPGTYRIAAEPSAAGNQARWISVRSRTTEVTILPGAASTVELPVPETPK
jgi:hypothetical protein